MSVSPDAPVVAVDVGGTAIKGAVISDGSLVYNTETPTPKGVEEILQAIEALLGRLCAGAPQMPLAAGVIVPGSVDERSGVALFSENLRWRDVPIGARLGQKYEFPVVIGQDVQAAGRAEYQFGTSHGSGDAVIISLGTGIAASIFSDGQHLRGLGQAGEIGHIRVADGPVCVCGARGCLESIASAAAIRRAYLGLGHPPLTTREIVELATHQMDLDAQRVWDFALDAIATGIAQIIGLLDPARIIFVGGLSNAGEALLNGVQDRLDEMLTFQRRPELSCGLLGDRAGVWGAALLACEHCGVDLIGELGSTA